MKRSAIRRGESRMAIVTTYMGRITPQGCLLLLPRTDMAIRRRIYFVFTDRRIMMSRELTGVRSSPSQYSLPSGATLRAYGAAKPPSTLSGILAQNSGRAPCAKDAVVHRTNPHTAPARRWLALAL